MRIRLLHSVAPLARRFAIDAARRAVDGYYWAGGLYRPPQDLLGFSPEHPSIPLRTFSPEGKTIVHSPDFLPDRLSFSGTLFIDSPQVEFARQYLRDRDFDYRRTRYYKLAAKGHLPFPCHGREAAERRCARYIYLIERIRAEGYRPEKYSPISLIECTNRDIMVLNGKHRLAALLALGASPIPAAFCFDNEIRARWRRRLERCWPLGRYRHSRKQMDRIGTLLVGKEEAVDTLLRRIKTNRFATRADIYHPIPFYEFRNLTTQVHYTTPYRRLGMVLSEYRDLHAKKILDLGCNVGFYSFSLARRGAEVTGFDACGDFIDLAAAVSALYAVAVDFVNATATPELLLKTTDTYDIVLCFSMLQWVIHQRGEAYGRELLAAISRKSEALFFDVAVNRGKACLTCKPGGELAFVHNLLRGATSYDTVLHVGDVRPYGDSVRHVFYCTH